MSSRIGEVLALIAFSEKGFESAVQARREE
jgi:hypothetical protein